jgi:hypothetical protein
LYLGFHVGFGCCGYVVSYGFFMWASWVALVYTSCVLRGALRFFNEIFLLIKKKKKCICFLWCSSSNLTSTLSCTLYICCFSSAIVGYTKHSLPRSSPLINFMNHMCQSLDYFSCLPVIVFPTN